MSDRRVKTFFKFLIESYNGDLPADQAFHLKHESRHLNVPSPAAPEDPSVHYAAAVAAKTKVPPGSRTTAKPKARKGKQTPKPIVETDSDSEEFLDRPGLMEDNDVARLDHALERGAEKPATSNARKSHKLRIDSPPQSNSSTTDQLQEKLPVTEGASKRPDDLRSGTGPRPRTILNQGVDEVVHKRFVPGSVEDPATWTKVKSDLAEWGENMTFWNNKYRTMPYSGLSGVRQDIRLPSGLHAAFSILQLWNAYQRPSGDSDSVVQLTINPMSDLEELHPRHNVTQIFREISDPLRTLPSAKHIYEQLQTSEGSANALFLQLESAVSKHIDGMVASEESIFEADLDLLKALWITTFMGASGPIRDVGKVQSNTSRTLALTDRFVAVLAAIAFARYMKVALTRVAQLYLEEAQEDDRLSMWKHLILVWDIGCKSLARALVHRRSDTFSLQRLSPILPKKFPAILTYAFVERPWWTPGDEGAPGPLKILNKQAIAIEPFFKMLEALPWTQLSFIERGQVLLLIILAAIQIETGRIPANRFAEAPKPASRRLAEKSGEMGPTENSIVIPIEDAAPHTARWIWESRKSAKLTTQGAPDVQVDGEPISKAGEGLPTQPHADVSQEDLLVDPPNSRTCNPPEISHTTASSVLPPEEEDPTLPQDTAPFLPHAANDAKTSRDLPSSPLPVHETAQTSDDLPPSAIPTVRRLDDPPLPPAKKRRAREALPVPSEDDAPVGRTLRSAAKKPVETAPTAGGGPIPILSTEASSSKEKGREAVEGLKTCSTTKNSGPAKPARARPTPKPSGKAVGKAKA
ncbi:hypothetical protein FS837_012087 [Tulasnella sp. UAMH 9824]|nr:hypothetical protein FS837_012087 [Tulasnella sp. UAMH 9824]